MVMCACFLFGVLVAVVAPHIWPTTKADPKPVRTYILQELARREDFIRVQNRALADVKSETLLMLAVRCEESPQTEKAGNGETDR